MVLLAADPLGCFRWYYYCLLAQGVLVEGVVEVRDATWERWKEQVKRRAERFLEPVATKKEPAVLLPRVGCGRPRRFHANRTNRHWGRRHLLLVGVRVVREVREEDPVPRLRRAPKCGENNFLEQRTCTEIVRTPIGTKSQPLKRWRVHKISRAFHSNRLPSVRTI